MNKKTKKTYRALLAAIPFIFILGQGCQKEFLPDPMGEPIPSTQYPELSEVLKSEGYNLFKAAWERSNIEEIISARTPRNRITFFVPTDGAMTTAGYSQAEIAAADPADLDSLLAYHILSEEITAEQLEHLPSNQMFSSVLTHAGYKEGVKADVNNIKEVPYRYLHYIDRTDDGLLSNGVIFKVEKESRVSGGNMLGINKVLYRPKKQMIDVLKEDGRFTLFLKAMDLNVLIYDDYVVNNLQAPGYVGYRYLVDYNYITKELYAPSYLIPHVVRFTLFAPTDEAFHQLGIMSEEDLDRINKRIRDYSDMYTATPLDSLLRYHKIGEAYNNTDIDWDLYVGITVLQQISSANNAVFYANRIDNVNLGDYDIILPAATDSAKKLEYDFGKDAAGRVTVKHKEASTEPATIIEENINTIQGPVHVVNRIIVPKDFRMWHVK